MEVILSHDRKVCIHPAASGISGMWAGAKAGKGEDQPAPHPDGERGKRRWNQGEGTWRTGQGRAGDTRIHFPSHRSPSRGAGSRFPSLHPIPCPSRFQNEQQNQKAKICLDSSPREALESPNPDKFWEAQIQRNSGKSRSREGLRSPNPIPAAPSATGRGWGGRRATQPGWSRWINSIPGCSCQGNAGSGHVGKLGMTQPGAGMHQEPKDSFPRKTLPH